MNYNFLKKLKIFFIFYYIIKITNWSNIAFISRFIRLIWCHGDYAIGNVIHIKTVGQLEIIASMIYQINMKIYFKEKNSIKENLGIIFIIIAIFLIILFLIKS